MKRMLLPNIALFALILVSAANNVDLITPGEILLFFTVMIGFSVLDKKCNKKEEE